MSIAKVLAAVGLLAFFVFGCREPSESSYQLVWEDHFESERVDPAKWSVIKGDGCPALCGWGNNEKQHYTGRQENVRIEDGVLILEAHKEIYDSSRYTSAKLVTKNKGDWKWAKVEIRAKLPAGRGSWPAIWMLPTMDEAKRQWPEDGEIDIVEHVGFNQDMVYGTIHTGRYNGMYGNQKVDSMEVAGASDQYHVYGLEWTEEELKWSVDGDIYYTLNRGDEDKMGWPFNENKFHLIMNLAVGGHWGGRQGVDETIWPQRLSVDYVKVYQRQP